MSFSSLKPWIVDTPLSSLQTFKKFDTTDTLSVNKFSCFNVSSTTSPMPADRTIMGTWYLVNFSKASTIPSLRKEKQCHKKC